MPDNKPGLDVWTLGASAVAATSVGGTSVYAKYQIGQHNEAFAKKAPTLNPLAQDRSAVNLTELNKQIAKGQKAAALMDGVAEAGAASRFIGPALKIGGHAFLAAGVAYSSYEIGSDIAGGDYKAAAADTVSAGGGFVGGTIGAAIGTVILPGPGTIAGGVIGATLGSKFASADPKDLPFGGDEISAGMGQLLSDPSPQEPKAVQPAVAEKVTKPVAAAKIDTSAPISKGIYPPGGVVASASKYWSTKLSSLFGKPAEAMTADASVIAKPADAAPVPRVKEASPLVAPEQPQPTADTGPHVVRTVQIAALDASQPQPEQKQAPAAPAKADAAKSAQPAKKHRAAHAHHHRHHLKSEHSTHPHAKPHHAGQGHHHHHHGQQLKNEHAVHNAGAPMSLISRAQQEGLRQEVLKESPLVNESGKKGAKLFAAETRSNFGMGGPS